MNRKYSLKKNREFQYVYRAGKSYGNKHLVLLTARSRRNCVQVGFSISKKVGNSVVRNRVKRQLRECFRLRLGSIKSGYNYVFVARPAAAGEAYSTLERSMESLLKRGGAYCVPVSKESTGR